MRRGLLRGTPVGLAGGVVVVGVGAALGALAGFRGRQSAVHTAALS